MFTFIKKLFSNDDPPKRFCAEDARRLIQNRADSERQDYERRRPHLFDSVYERIQDLAVDGEDHLVITSEPFSDRFSRYIKWPQQDIDWFAADFEKVFLDDGYTFEYGVNDWRTWKGKRILIKW